ncbi:riboflavin biosynthesis protein RibF [Thermodesulfobacterium geofontis OPF15]|uniref:Riboflavin biosynthesis protein n=1 Tax=Thermodesulfobacterium geofontis (strain OPF15) TaxID=795359 RepID=F8C4D1_THEGP|nr:bifunctional riboflavin kinase/FAD synthetase [Thermodesulfobacterium geofontis]AEH22634.1 riboflavin biosynthesis protein RibF [Thermodesulfobacterium geofontis OPF15]
MKIYTPKDFPLPFETVITIGSFDGIHLAHKALFEETKKLANLLNVKPVVVSFDPHPRTVLFPESNLKLLTTLEEKLYLLSLLEIENLVLIPFTKTLSELSHDLFVQEYIVDKIKAKGIIVGFNFRFGKFRKGDVDYLNKVAKKYNFIVKAIPPVMLNGVIISSSAIRNLIEKGNIESANELLGRPYLIMGKVIKGKGRGKEIGYPTANLEVSPLKLLPPSGVYAVWVLLNGEKLKGALNIGKRPTFGEKEISIEVHIFNFNRNIYGKTLKIEIIKRIRDEKKFPSIENLKIQIEKDCKLIDEILH